MAKDSLANTERGLIEEIKLRRAIFFNGNSITRAVIEIDHINYGLDKKTGKLKKTKRSNFSLRDVEKFLVLLDGESIFPSGYRGKRSKFDIRINCPIKGQFYKKEFIMIFDTHYDHPEKIYTITLYPGW